MAAGLDTSRMGNVILQNRIARLEKRCTELEASSDTLLQETVQLREIVKELVGDSKNGNVKEKLTALFNKHSESEAVEGVAPTEEDSEQSGEPDKE